MNINLISPWVVRMIGAIAASLILNVAAHAQTSRGTVSGTVMDQSGEIAAGARVALTNTQTGVRLEAAANEAGIYRVCCSPRTRGSISISTLWATCGESPTSSACRSAWILRQVSTGDRSRSPLLRWRYHKRRKDQSGSFDSITTSPRRTESPLATSMSRGSIRPTRFNFLGSYSTTGIEIEIFNSPTATLSGQVTPTSFDSLMHS